MTFRYSQYGTPGSWKKDGAQAVAAAATATAAKNASVSQKKIDVNAVGLINGQPIYEYDMDADQDEKPWKKPGKCTQYWNFKMHNFKGANANEAGMQIRLPRRRIKFPLFLFSF